jgi:hypothetical protein
MGPSVAPGDLPKDVRSFVTRHVASVLELDLLLAMRSAGRPYTPEEIARDLRLNEAACAAGFEKFAAEGLFVRKDDGYSYEPRDAGARAGADALAEAYAVRRVSVIRFIYRQPGGGVTAFADAFKLRKDD